MRAPTLYALPTNRRLRWLVTNRDPLDENLLRQLLGGPFSSRSALFAGALNSLLISWTCAFLNPTPVFIGWMILDTLIWLARLVLVHCIQLMGGLAPPLLSEVSLILGLLWTATLGMGTAACILSGDAVLQMLGCTSAVAMNGAITMRNQGIPRYAFLQILLTDVPMKLATLFQPEPMLRLFLLQAPLYLSANWILLNNLNRNLLRSLTAEADSRWHATHDDLTGLYNRAGILALLEGALRRPRSWSASVAVFYLDLDGFKGVNDSQGHAAGDRLLRACGALLAGSVRQSDFAGRLGGDEFLLVMQDATEEGARELAQRILERLSAQGMNASIGIALQQPLEDGPSLLARADQALYTAKLAGKGGFRVAHPTVSAAE
ncbi:GGDEF domain-containing protein [Pseudomonas sp. EpS/L25]|uniref:GGDEF domain-containing protein n=1 Tax=Pseudomonas sp. EpS/L25 TaxID=1749078 RepID=UPI000802948A|nr:GGDEF domain-containing protein [Pseudomonas sp. EpS/L25]